VRKVERHELVADASHLTDVTSWRPRVAFRDGIAALVRG